MIDIRKTVLERFLRYVNMNTQSSEEGEGNPSTPEQWDLLRLLETELNELGLQDVNLSEGGVLTGLLPGSGGGEDAPVIALLAHVDTYPGTSGKDIKPQILENYDGRDIKLTGTGESLTLEENPDLASYKGDTVITTDGTTLLGADDKAGVAEIMTALEVLIANPEMPRAPIKVAFTPDEEIGQGTATFPPINEFGAHVGYTLDGGPEGEVENETFCADTAIVKFKGKDVHPGYAKGKMVSAIRAASHFVTLFPGESLPETTQGKQGYIHPIQIKGDVNEVVVPVLVRDFELEKLKEWEAIIEELTEKTKEAFPGLEVEIDIQHSYKNMRHYLDKEPRAVEIALKAVDAAGVKVNLTSIRGGTDGSRLSEMGLPTPNLFAGGRNFHSVREWVPLNAMEKAVRVVFKLAELWSKERI